jgi:hypothetical protein
MKKLFLTLLLATLCATGYGQTIKSLGYNTSGEVVYTGTNLLTFTNDVTFNTILSGGSNSISMVNGEFFGPWYFDEAVLFSDPATTRTNLGLGATWLTNDNVTNFRTAIGLGATNEVTFQNVTIEAGALYISQGTNQYFYAGDDLVESYVPVTIFHPNGLDFGGTNAAAAASATRTNLGLPLPALTNTSNVTFQGAIFPATTTNAPTNTNAPTPDAWLDIQVGTNSYKLPLWQ